MDSDMLGPEQLQGDTLAFELLVNLEVIGLGKARGLLRCREQQALQLGFIRAFSA